MTIETMRVRRWWMIAAASLGMLIVALLLIVAAFPWGMLQGIVADRLAKRFGRPVTIGSVVRLDRIGFSPTIAVRDLRIPQPRWAGTGDFARLREAQVTFPVWPLLTGTFQPRDIRVTGLRLAMVRARDGRTNWARPGEPETGGSSTALQGLTVSDSMISYRDDKRDRQVAVAFASDARGLRASGAGTIRGVPVRLAVIGAAVDQPRPGPWPFTARIDGPSLVMQARGAMDRPLDTDRMTLNVAARATDLKLIDAVVEAGLFHSQPVALTARVRHAAPDWSVDDLKGTIGRSDIAGRLTVQKREGRTRLEGTVAAQRFDFDDLSSDRGLAKQRALEARIGPRVVPNTRINLANLAQTDGRLSFRVDRVISRTGDTSVTGLNGTVNLDRQRLEVAPLTIGLAGGRARGRIVVDQRGGAASPLLDLDLRMNGSRMELLAGEDDVAGRIAAHARLRGRGDTVREAIGRADGRIGLVVRDGTLPARYAAALGFDAGRALTAGAEARATLRCLILRLPVSGGRGTVQPLVVDTSTSKLTGTGTIVFPEERIAIAMNGAPKHRSLLRLTGTAYLTGRLRDPKLDVPPAVKSAGNILKAIGRAITGDTAPLATNADCAALSAQALR